MTSADKPAPASEGVDQDAMFAILRDARQRLEKFQAERDERVAIVGLAGRFPGADDVDAFWRLLRAGESGLRSVDDAELEQAGVDAEVSSRPDYVRVWGGFDDPTGFDAGFFGYSPRDAELLDPQQRVFLECAWGALEHAGYDSRTYQGRIGVYAGGALTYNFSNIQANRTLRETVDPIHAGLSNVIGLIASRVAYHLDLKGPSVGVQATCASSLISLHLAARALLAREADMALAGAVAIGQPRPEGYVYKSEGVSSPDGLCRPFDAAAQGTVFTNGVGVVVLKRLSDALADGDTVYAVVRGSAIGNDGAAKVGLTAPSIAGQQAVLEAALADARIAPASIDYVEAHGTATALGDPIELASLNRVYGAAFKAEGRECGIGSVKGNIGHMDVAAGMGGLIKTVLALRHGSLPASINFNTPNPGFDLAASPFRVITENRDWQRTPERPRRAAISAFGMGGMNAHVILEEAPLRPAEAVIDGPQLLPLSARSPEALRDMRDALAATLGDTTPANLAGTAFTLQTGRRPMAHRFVGLVHDKASACALLAAGEGPDCVAGEVLPGDPSLVFLFPGQGSQHAGMARELYDRDPVFKAAFDACIAGLPDDLDLKTLLYAGDASPEALNRTEATQPALFVVEYALAQMWLARGLQPRALLGHSIGEYVAACLAGVFSLEDALRIVCARGRLMQACAPGAMLSVMLSETEARSVLSADVELAAVNGPRSCVLAGTTDAIAALAEQFDRSGLGSRPLRTSHAFHSFMMEPALEEFSEILGTVKLNPPMLDILSNLTGDWLTAEQATDPAYWVAHLRGTVLFGPGLARVLELPNPVLLEVGPGSSLTRLARQQARPDMRAVASLPDAGSARDAADHALLAFGELWTAGIDVDWAMVRKGASRRVGLPTYPFQHTSYWIPPVSPVAVEDGPSERLADLSDWFHQPTWTRDTTLPVVDDRRGERRRWLLLNGRVTATAIGALSEHVETIHVEVGDSFAFDGETYRLDPADADHYRALLADLAAKGYAPDQIVNGFALGREPGSNAGFASTLALGRALTDVAEKPALLTVLASGMHQVTGSEMLDPHAAMVLGSLRVLPQELPGLNCRSIDLPDTNPASMVAGLSGALLRPWREDATVSALRGGFAWLVGHVASPVAEPAEVPTLQDGATYLVAGDLVDGLGLIYARALIQSHGARVILAGRAGLPPPAEWEHWLASHSPQHPVSRFVRTLRDIDTPGEHYVLFSGDLSDPEWLAPALDDGQRRFSPIRGVFHTAGMGELFHCPLAETTMEGSSGLFATKVAGLPALAAALSTAQPDFVLVQSSLSSILGGGGLAAYAAANSFLDAFVEAQRGKTQPVWQAINWDTCLPYGQNRGEGGSLYAKAIDADEVWQVTRAVLARPELIRVVVTPEHLHHRMAAAMQATVEATPAAPDAATGRQGIRTAYVAPRDPVEATVASVMRELLGIERIGAMDNFFELGGHSLLAVQVVTRLRKQFATDLPMRALLFEAPTVAGIAAVIRDSLEAARREQETLEALLDGIEAVGARREA
ncbi:type I polyketide synthase [Shinella kummerowiae]|nr:type I polyketide synthase [Shinella kummerowiae]